MTFPAIDGWSVKDIIAHVVWHEREVVGVLTAKALVGSDLWDLPLAKRNAAIFEQTRDRPLNEVLAEARVIYAQFLEGLQTLTDEDLNDSGRFADMPTEWQPWKLIAENSYEHYHDHRHDIQSWLAQTK